MSQPLLITAQPASNWTAQNPILPQFTIGRESDTGKEKLGNGVSAWADLSYSNPSGAVSAGDITTAVNAAVAALVDGAPGALDTLNELAAALADDAAFSTTVTNALAARLVAANNLSDVVDPAVARANLEILTNEAPANTIPKSDGAGFVTSPISAAGDDVTFAGAVIIPGLPTSDPEVVGQLYVTAGALMVSAG